MDTFLCILKAIAGYFILMFAGTNLLGIVVRGLRPTLKKDSDGNLVLNAPSFYEEWKKSVGLLK